MYLSFVEWIKRFVVIAILSGSQVLVLRPAFLIGVFVAIDCLWQAIAASFLATTIDKLLRYFRLLSVALVLLFATFLFNDDRVLQRIEATFLLFLVSSEDAA